MKSLKDNLIFRRNRLSHHPDPKSIIEVIGLHLRKIDTVSVTIKNGTVFVSSGSSVKNEILIKRDLIEKKLHESFPRVKKIHIL